MSKHRRQCRTPGLAAARTLQERELRVLGVRAFEGRGEIVVDGAAR
jgi:hypothetical protein